MKPTSSLGEALMNTSILEVEAMGRKFQLSIDVDYRIFSGEWTFKEGVTEVEVQKMVAEAVAEDDNRILNARIYTEPEYNRVVAELEYLSFFCVPINLDWRARGDAHDAVMAEVSDLFGDKYRSFFHRKTSYPNQAQGFSD